MKKKNNIKPKDLRESLLRGDAFPVKIKYGKYNDFQWAAEVWNLWKRAGFPVLLGGVSADQARIAKAILGI